MGIICDIVSLDLPFLLRLLSSSSVTCAIRYSALCLSDPGRVISVENNCSHELIPLDGDVDVEGSVCRSNEHDDAPACASCGLVPPLRSRHCHACRCCVRTYDHHCFWIGTCVGEKNHVLFALFLWVQSAVLLVALAFIGDALQHDDGSALHAFKVTVLVCLLCALVMVGGLAVFHAYLLRTGQTTREVPCRICSRMPLT
jgi:hypothetical protein